MEEANKVEQLYQRRVEGISENLHNALRTHARHAHEDITHTLVEHARASIHYERSRLRELETLRPDVARANGPAQSVPAQPVPAPNGRSPLPPPIRGPLIQPPLGPNSAPSSGPPSPRVVAPKTPGQQAQVVPTPQGAPGHSSPLPQHSSAGPSTPVTSGPIDPLAGPPRSQSATPTHPNVPLPGPPLSMSTASIPGTPNAPQTPVHPLAKSMFVQPTHRKLDPREAAAKLANMF